MLLQNKKFQLEIWYSLFVYTSCDFFKWEPPPFAILGSYDGEIIIWNSNSEGVSKKLQQRSRQRIRRPITAISASRDDDMRPLTSESQGNF